MGDSVIGGRYRVARRLGGGTYGRVFEAVSPSGEHVAVKVIRETLLVRDEERLRFEREAAIMRGLSHPHIVRVLDSGYTGRGAPFIVFELLTGRSLSQELKRVRFMSAARVANIARQVLGALGHAHAHGVVHRDIKPSNVHLCRSSTEVDHVKVLDFGVAKQLEEGELERLTEAGAMVGTPGYMAPEQLCGDPVEPATDLFSVGMMMARLLSGERFIGETLVEVIRSHMTEGPISVPRSVEISELGAVVQKAVMKMPADRYRSADQMAEAIDSALRGVTSGPTSASGTVLMPEHLEIEEAPNSTIPLDHMPWLNPKEE